MDRHDPACQLHRVPRREDLFRVSQSFNARVSLRVHDCRCVLVRDAPCIRRGKVPQDLAQLESDQAFRLQGRRALAAVRADRRAVPVKDMFRAV